MKTVYLLLTRSGTLVARAIRALDGRRLLHARVARRGSGAQASSTALREAACARTPLPAGFVREIHRRRVLRPPRLDERARCTPLDVPDEAFARIGRAAGGDARRGPGVPLQRDGAAAVPAGDWPLERERRMFCSQFVARLLEQSGAMALPKPPSLMRPADFASPAGNCGWIYFGELRGAAECAAARGGGLRMKPQTRRRRADRGRGAGRVRGADGRAVLRARKAHGGAV